MMQLLTSTMLIVVSITLVLTTGFWSERVADLKQDAFDRGYMVECVGKTGYYWECDDEKTKERD